MTHTPAVPTVPVGLEPLADGRQSAPAAQRNQAPLLQQLTPWLRPGSRVLELASGTGEHAVAFNQACPGLHWQPTDIAPERLQSMRLGRRRRSWPRHRPAALFGCGPAALASTRRAVGRGAGHQPTACDARRAPARAVCRRARRLAASGLVEGVRPVSPGGGMVLRGQPGVSCAAASPAPQPRPADLAELAALARAAGFGAMQVQPMPANNQLLCWRVAEHG